MSYTSKSDPVGMTGKKTMGGVNGRFVKEQNDAGYRLEWKLPIATTPALPLAVEWSNQDLKTFHAAFLREPDVLCFSHNPGADGATGKHLDKCVPRVA